MDNISFCEFCNKLTISNHPLYHLGGEEEYITSICHECGKTKITFMEEKS